MKRGDLMKVNWGIIELGELFHIKKGKSISQKNRIKGDIPYIGASLYNNGIIDFISYDSKSLQKNILGLNCDGSVGECFYHPYYCIFSEHVNRLQLKNQKGNKYLYLYFKTCILKQKNKYSFGYAFNDQRMKKQKIKVPITENNEVDYSYMENYMRSIEKKLLLKK